MTITDVVSFRLSAEAMTIIICHAADLSTFQGKDVNRTEALEHIIQTFAQGHKPTIGSKIRRRLFAQGEQGLETFLALQKQLEHDQLEAALH